MALNALDITGMLGGTWHGRCGTAPCPVCQPESRQDQNALTLADSSDGRLLAHCKKLGCQFREILAAAGLARGDYTPPDTAILERREVERQAEAAKKAKQAQRIWEEAKPVEGTLASRYLRERGISCALPETLRFHPECWHGPTATRHPALVALVEGTKGFAVHRTYLRPDGMGKATVDPSKMMLGATRGGAVRLSECAHSFAVAEGVETALSLLSGLLRRPATVLAALSTSNMAGLNLPPTPGRLTIAPDGDRAGHGAALSLASRATRGGWAVSILTPPPGGDFNDLLQNEVTV